MKDKEKQIEEMAKVIEKTIQTECLLNNNGHCSDCKFIGKDTYEYQCQSLLVSTVLYNAGYRKVPDGAVVLLIGENNQALDEKTIEYFVKHNVQIRKETAKEILDLIAKIIKEEYGGEPPCNFNCNDEYMFDNCDEFCCEYCNTPDNEKNYERCWIEFFKSKMKKYGVEVEE